MDRKKKKTRLVEPIESSRETKLVKTAIVWAMYFLWVLKVNSTSLSLLNFVVHIMFAGIMVYIYIDDIKRCFKEFGKNPGKNFLKILLYLVIYVVIMTAGNIIADAIMKAKFGGVSNDSSSMALYKIFSNVPFGTLFVILTTTLFYPIVEELVFRKSLRDIIPNKYIYVIISALGHWYFQVTIINPEMTELVSGLPYLFFSIFAAIIYVKKENILYTILPRTLYNLLMSVIQLLTL